MMSRNDIFSFKNLNCSYNGGSIVLKVNDLTIEKKKLVFILGESGSGKSTFLEMVGLMNNTSSLSSEMYFFPDDENAPISLLNLWEAKNAKLLSYLRNRYYSFIFQNTNLMPNFTAYENIALSQMIQGTSFKEANEKIEKVMHQIGLGTITRNKKAYELSGGERQRVAFVRAITTDFEVIFGDEPTGNLDGHNAYELMSILKKTINENGKTGIMVSHDVELALRFADQIIIIKKIHEEGSHYGLISDDNIFLSNGSSEQKEWRNGHNRVMNNVRDSIISLMT